jgi:hypothetical protein
MIEDAKQLLYAGVGILERTDEVSEPFAIDYAILTKDDEVAVEYTDGSKESFPAKQGSIEPYTFGIVLFSTRDGGEYIIREVTDLDGSWISKYKIKLPPVTLKDLLTKPEVDFQMPYLETEQESLIALVEPEDKGVVGVMYTNTFGAFVRINEMWVSISPSDTSFDGLTTYDVKAETAEEFISTFDDSDVSFIDVEDYLTAVE